ncbi:MAG: hypothetical protein C0404_06665 [Verrucomicrobia bacterium]|nr:hypothetical protein [Verrucomicrobiota bacterium]
MGLTALLIQRVKDAASDGVRIHYIANAGDGEPTLHPHFAECMDMYGEMLKNWPPTAAVAAPEVSVVTNGSSLAEPGVLDAIVRNGITLIVSFPTSDPASYGEVMAGEPSRGAELLAKVLPGLRRAMSLAGAGWIRKLQFHISPPVRDIVRRDFPKTVDFLSSMAAAAGLKSLDLIMFPATTNRSGLIRNSVKGADMYADLFGKFNGQVFNGVKVNMRQMFRRFFRSLFDLFDLIRSYEYPCLWNSQLFIAPNGESICCNDQAVRNPMGNIRADSIRSLIERKETYVPGRTCTACDQQPAKMTGGLSMAVFARLAAARQWLAAMKGTRRVSETPAPATNEPLAAMEPVGDQIA